LRVFKLKRSPPGANQRRLATPYAFGYIFGFADAMAQRAGARRDTAILAFITVVFIEMFGREQGTKVFALCLTRQNDPEFAAGRRAGGSELIAWLSSPGGKEVPLGLTEYLQGKAG